MNVADSEFKELLSTYKKFVVYGLSPDDSKPSQKVPQFMKSKGYDVVGTYPGHSEIAGFKIYQKLADVPSEYRKFVDVFRSSDRVPQVIDEAIAAGGVEVIWLQLGISNPDAEAKAEKAGIRVVSTRCLHIEYLKHMQE